MELITTEKELTMDSLEIAEVVGSRHDKVKQSIERLSKRGVIELPPMGDISTATKPMKVYNIGKRDSYVVVAQMSPEFTALLVDRWEALESGAVKPLAVSRDEVIARGMIAAQEVIEEQTVALQDAKPKIDFHDSVMASTRNFKVGEAAKLIASDTGKSFGRNTMMELLRRLKWIMKNTNEPYQSIIDRGYMTMRMD